jgi:transposase
MIENILPGNAAIDVGSTEHFVAAAGADVRSFGTHTADIHLLCAHLKSHQITRVAMEATGVYWIPLHDMLREAGFEVTVFNGAHARNLPGRKTDVSDCQWHAMLHSHGLLRPCFIADEDILRLRTLHRLREDHLSMAQQHIAHMQKALDLMNVRLHTVISQIHGVSGLRVIRAILDGERSAIALAALCDTRIRKTKEKEVIKSLQGRWSEHHLFALRQALECYEFYQKKMSECDAEIDRLLEEMNRDKPQIDDPPAPRKKIRHNAPTISEFDSKMLRLSEGRDVAALPGITALGMMKLIAEIGLDLSPWPTEKHFTAWLGLAPGRHSSGKRRRRPNTKNTKAGQIFREAAMSVSKSKHLALGAYYRRVKGRRGPAIAMKALARKIAVLFYRVMTKGMEYVEHGIEAYQQRYEEQRRRYVEKLARGLGLSIVDDSIQTSGSPDQMAPVNP